MKTKHEITGRVKLHYSHEIPGKENEEKACICCPGHKSHVYMQEIVLPEYASRYPAHFGLNLDGWVKSMFPFMKLNGRAIRVTAELVDEGKDGS